MPDPEAGATVLAGARVLVTRPAHQAQTLCELIAHAGGTPVRFPTIEIVAPQNPAALERILARLDEFDLAIFVSPNAVSRAMGLVQRLPARLAIACLGSGSTRALAQFGVRDVIAPPVQTDSEGLLALEPLRNIAGRRVVIFRGEDGRDVLATMLAARGATVEHAVCYRRVRPALDTAALSQQFAGSRIDVVTITSADALRNLIDMLDEPARTALRRTPLVTISQRLEETARTLGLQGPIHVATTATDDAILAALRAWRGSQNTL